MVKFKHLRCFLANLLSLRFTGFLQKKSSQKQLSCLAGIHFTPGWGWGTLKSEKGLNGKGKTSVWQEYLSGDGFSNPDDCNVPADSWQRWVGKSPHWHLSPLTETQEERKCTYMRTAKDLISF